MGYAVSDSVVRADRFKPSGKWYDTIALEMEDFFERDGIHEAIKAAMLRQGIALEKGWSIVVLEPYHQHSHPIMLRGE